MTRYFNTSSFKKQKIKKQLLGAPQSNALNYATHADADNIEALYQLERKKERVSNFRLTYGISVKYEWEDPDDIKDFQLL